MKLLVNGQPIALGRLVGRGGEGEVYKVAGHPKIAVKLYRPEKRQSREDKIMTMVRQRYASRSAFVAYPTQVVRDGKGRFAGFLMSLIDGYKPLFELYSPGARKLSFPKADFRFLVRVATNVARAIASVHQDGCVVGDINHSGILVSDKALVVLIDADSFQVVEGNNQFFCRVGVPEYTPPELHNINLGSTARTPNHDAFGLAIVIFQLLFMGRHPFVGTVRSGDVPKIDHAIRDYRFVYAEDRNVGMDQPPGTPTLSDFTGAVAENFEAAFSKKTAYNRPQAVDWVRALNELEGALIKCTADALHYYSREAQDCPWCEMDCTIGMTLFEPDFGTDALTTTEGPGARGFNLVGIVRRINTIKLPPTESVLPQLRPLELHASEQARTAKREQTSGRWKGFFAMVAAAGILTILPALWIVWVPLGIWGFGQIFGEGSTNATSHRRRFVEAEEEWYRGLAEWRKRIGLAEAAELKRTLQTAERDYKRLGAKEKHQIAEYQKNRRNVQLKRFLDTHQIHRATIRGIGPAKEATLASYGIETAADITRSRVLSLPGFGPINSKPLFEWRDRLAARFVYNPKPNVTDQQEIARIKNSIVQERTALRRSLLAGPEALGRLQRQIQQMARRQDGMLNRLHRKREQARADLKYLGIVEPRVVPSQAIPTSQPTPRSGRTIPPSPAPTTSSSIPSCPRCGSSMRQRMARRGRYAGKPFYGCSRYPACKGIINI